MRIEIHRGHGQIGGNVVEIASGETRILLDVGSELGEGSFSQSKINTLIQDPTIDAVFISHYHGDHMGEIEQIDRQVPTYMSHFSYKIIKTANEYQNKPTFREPEFFTEGNPVVIGDLNVTPILCDHSAYDSHMFLIEGEGKKILYTGDFRANGRISFDDLLDKLPPFVDAIIVEGTCVSRGESTNDTEAQLEERAIVLFAEAKGPIFVLMSAQNIDRITTIANAAKHANRLLLQDVYMAGITRALDGKVVNPKSHDNIRVFTDKSLDKNDRKYESLNQYGNRKISRDRIAKEHFVMCIRTSMADYLTRLSRLMSFEGGYLIYSMWQGYRENQQMKNFLKQCSELGLEIESLHTSGHADISTIKQLIDRVNPSAILPVHTLAEDWFTATYGSELVRLESQVHI